MGGCGVVCMKNDMLMQDIKLEVLRAICYKAGAIWCHCTLHSEEI